LTDEPIRFVVVPVGVNAQVVPVMDNLRVCGVVRGPQGIPGTPGGSTVTRTASGVISGHRVVKALAGGAVGYPSISDTTDAGLIEGITTGAADPGADVTVQIAGQMVEPSWNWSLGPVYCADNGVLSQSVPSGAWLRQVAVAVAPDTIIIALQPVFIIV
jgi:hypothetical protein